jgi:hypothetical protein
MERKFSKAELYRLRSLTGLKTAKEDILLHTFARMYLDKKLNL